MASIRKIKLTQGKFALVDEQDFEWLNQWKWFVVKDGNTHYASRHIYKDGKRTTSRMHREIINPPKDLLIDHINRSGLDNRRNNLRIVTTFQNQWNRKPAKNLSGHEGVRWDKGKWRIDMRVNNKNIYFGRFVELKDAIEARQQIKRQYRGEFANG